MNPEIPALYDVGKPVECRCIKLHHKWQSDAVENVYLFIYSLFLMSCPIFPIVNIMS